MPIPGPLPTRSAPRDVAPVALVAAAAIGLCADIAVRVLPQGIDFVVVVAALLAMLVWTARRTGQRLTRVAYVLAAFALVFPLATLTRDASQLVVLDVLATLSAGCALVVVLRRGAAWSVDDAGPIGYAVGGAATVARVVGGAPQLVARVAGGATVTRSVALAGVGTVVRGGALAAPVLVVFAALLTAADPAFGRLFEPLAALDLDIVGEHLVVAVAVAWASAGTLQAALLARADAPAAADGAEGLVAGATRLVRTRLTQLRLGAREVVVALVLVDALLALFAMLQLRWLVGGGAALREAGLSVAEYARRGFFELVVLAMLALAVLTVANALAVHRAHTGDSPPRSWRLAGTALVALVLLLLVSAADRLRLYVDAHGLSLARFHAAALMTWLGVVFFWAAGTLLRGRPGRFAAGAVGAAWVLLFALHVVNPDARVAAVNLARAEAGRPIDTEYLRRLSLDAAPVLAARVPALLATMPDAEARCRLRAVLHDAARRAAQGDGWRGWRLPVARARAALPAWAFAPTPSCD